MDPSNVVSVPSAPKTRITAKRSASVVVVETHRCSADWSGEFKVVYERGGGETNVSVDVVLAGRVGDGGVGRRRFGAERAGRCVEMESGPLRSGQRPLVLVPPLEVGARPSDRELDRWLACDARVDVLEPLLEEPQLQEPTLHGVEGRDVVAAVHAQHLVLRASADVAVDIAAEMQPDASPVAGGEQWHFDGRQIGTGLVVQRHEFFGRCGWLGLRVRRVLAPRGCEAVGEDPAVAQDV